MPRIAALLLCALAALVATATPAPDKPWVTGWEKVDPKGDCKFEREGERLAITVPGEGHGVDDLDAPRLLREVEGDFVVEVRVTGECESSKEADGLRGAGILILGSEEDITLTLELPGRTYDGQARAWVRAVMRCPRSPGICWVHRLKPAPTSQRSMYLCLARRRDTWRMSYSEDHKKWTDLDTQWKVKLPRKLKVGVLAAATAEGAFKAVFDNFMLSRPGN
jgi:regulation of enolase protein 1 (concanavalin A-like superfamily)